MFSSQVKNQNPSDLGGVKGFLNCSGSVPFPTEGPTGPNLKTRP